MRQPLVIKKGHEHQHSQHQESEMEGGERLWRKQPAEPGDRGTAELELPRFDGRVGA